MSEIRVLLVDDHQVTREGTRKILEDAGGIRVIGEAGDGEKAVQLTTDLKPDILLLDIGLPKLDGVQVARIVRERVPEVRVVVLTGYDSPPYAQALLRLGVCGYLSKSGTATELREAIQRVHTGQTHFHQSVVRRLSSMAPAASSEGPTPRETEVLGLVAEGLRNRDIAGRLRSSERTVEFHLTNLFAKLGATSRTEMLHHARQRGWLN